MPLLSAFAASQEGDVGMFEMQKYLAAGLVPMLLVFGGAGMTMGASQSAETDERVRCEIRASSASGMIALEGIVHADPAVHGTYRFRVAGAGRSGGSNIQQGGQFAVDASGAATLGRVMLGNNGAAFDARLEVTADGITVECNERIGGAI
jgi:hypothetical protein